MKRTLLSIAAAACVFAALPAVAAEYECRRRDGTFAGNPVSKDDAKQWEERDGHIQCFRKGVPIISDRDRWRERMQKEYGNQQFGVPTPVQPWGGWSDRSVRSSYGVDQGTATRACLREAPGPMQVRGSWNRGGGWKVVLSDGWDEYECRVSPHGFVESFVRR